jgi:hypothetical protein
LSHSVLNLSAILTPRCGILSTTHPGDFTSKQFLVAKSEKKEIIALHAGRMCDESLSSWVFAKESFLASLEMTSQAPFSACRSYSTSCRFSAMRTAPAT